MSVESKNSYFLAAKGDSLAAARYRLLAQRNPELREEYLQRSKESQLSMARNLQLYKEARRKSVRASAPTL